MQTRLTQGRLLDARGRLSQAGYSTELIKIYDRADIRAHPLRVKEWDYYLIYNDSFGLALTVADNGYMGMLSASLLDFNAPAERTKSAILPFTLGRLRMPAHSGRGDVSAKNAKSAFEFLNDGQSRRLRGQMVKFGNNGETLSFDLTLSDPPADSMVIATPFPNKPKAFYYNQKIVGLRAQGEVSLGARKLAFGDSSLALLDWGRGVWTYDNTWYWSAACALKDGRAIGFNLGYGFGDTSAASENMVFFGGRAHKLSQISFGIPMTADGADDFMRPWRFSSSDGRFEAAFTPIIDRSARMSVGPLMSDQHQVFGHFDGFMILDGGEKVELEHVLGFAEKVRNKW